MLLLGSLHSLSLVHDKTIISWAMAVKRGNYSEETLREAVCLVLDEGYSYGDVFKLTGVPKTTLFKYAKSTVVIKKNVWKSDKSWEPEKIWKEKNWKFEKIWKFDNLKFKIAQVDPRDMLNKFCFHV